MGDLLMKEKKRKSIREKLIINTGTSMALLLFASMIISIGSLIFVGKDRVTSQETTSREAFDRLIKEQVDSAMSIAALYNKKYTTGEITLEQAKAEAADVIRNATYGQDGYFWVDTSQGDNVVLLGNATEGTNRFNATDNEGFSYIKAFIEQAKQAGGGYTDYKFPKPNQTDALPKRAYTSYFEPFDWIIGTGNYVDDIDVEINELLGYIRTETIVLMMISIVSGLLLFGLGLIFTIRISKNFSNHLNGLLLVSEQLAKGDTNIQTLESDIIEIQHLNESFASVVNSTYEQIGVLEQIANGNFTVSLTERSDCDVLVQSINKMVSLLNHTLNQINHSADQVTGGALQVSDSAQDLAESATTQASSVELLLSEITDISTQIKNTADNAASVNQLTTIVGEKLNTSNQQMDEMSMAMFEIDSASTEIRNIIKVIEDIAFQTNTLALNAAIEAARAGVAGKGFAVVADEVRNLATKGSEAAKQTGILIEGSVKTVQKGVDIAKATAESLMDVVDGVQEITQLISGISQASSLQNESISQITLEIGEISSVVQTNSAASEQSAASSEELSSQAELMKSLVSHFQLKMEPIK